MKSTELRIGNLVLLDTGQTLYYPHAIMPSDLELIHNDNLPKYASIEPIPLTEEWLLNFGFIRKNEWVGFISNKYRIGIRFFDGNSSACDIIQDGKFISFGYGHLKHVHQLQNLYFALTGEELTYTL